MADTDVVLGSDEEEYSQNTQQWNAYAPSLRSKRAELDVMRRRSSGEPLRKRIKILHEPEQSPPSPSSTPYDALHEPFPAASPPPAQAAALPSTSGTQPLIDSPHHPAHAHRSPSLDDEMLLRASSPIPALALPGSLLRSPTSPPPVIDDVMPHSQPRTLPSTSSSPPAFQASSPDLGPLPGAHPSQDDPPAPADDAENLAGRYSLRQRNPQQRNPYTVENALYRRQLKHHQEAIVSLGRLASGPTQDTQDREFVAEESQEQDSQLPDEGETPAVPGGAQVPDNGLDDLFAGDFADDRDWSRLRRLAKQKNREAEGQKARPLPKRHHFPGVPDTEKGKAPVHPSGASASRAPRPTSFTTGTEPSSSRRQLQRVPSRRRVESPPSSSAEHISTARPTTPSETDFWDGPPPTKASSSAGWRRHGSTSSVEMPASARASASSSSSGSDGSSSDSEAVASRRMFKTIGKMYPAVMAKRMMGAARASAKPKQQVAREHQGPLAAGQSRRRAGRAWVGDIKGDDESDDDLSDAGPSSRPASPLRRQRLRSSPPPFSPSSTVVEGAFDQDQPIDLTEDSPSSVDSSEEDEPVERAELEAWANRYSRPTSGSSRAHAAEAREYYVPREGDLFDRMLARSTNRPRSTRQGGARSHRRRASQKQAVHTRSRSRTVERGGDQPSRHRGSGAHRRPGADSPKKATSSRHRSRDGLHVVTGGAKRIGTERQTRLPFKPVSHRSQQASHHEGTHDQNNPHVHVVIDQDAEQESKKRKRKKRQRFQGQTYTFDNRSGFVPIHRLRKTETVRHVEDVAFIRAVSLAPNPPLMDRSTRVRRPGAAPPRSRAPMSRTSSGITKVQTNLYDFPNSGTWHGQDLTNLPDAVGVHHRLTSPEHTPKPQVVREFAADCGIEPLLLGTKFGAQTYLGKFYLSQLLSLMEARDAADIQPVDDPPSHSAFPAALAVFQDRLLAYLRAESSEPASIREMDINMHTMCQLLSRTLAGTGSAYLPTIYSAVVDLSGRLSPLLDANDVALNGITVAFVSVGWFLVELMLRIESSHHGDMWDTKHTDSAVDQLIRALYMHDISEAYMTCAMNEELDDTMIAPRVAGTWVCILHASLTLKRPHGQHPAIRALSQLMEEDKETMPPPQACEKYWTTIFHLCALARFSQYGIVTSNSAPFITTAWDLPLLTSKLIVFTASPNEMDNSEYTKVLVARDAFIKILVIRFYVLFQTWQWRMTEVSSIPVMSRLNEIFRSRRFADLHDETIAPQFPSFLVKDDLELVTVPRVKDTGFQVYLKIVLRAAYHLQEIKTPKAQNTLKKLVGIFLPVSNIIVPTRHGYSESREFRALFNRLSAYAAALLVDPTPSNADTVLTRASREVRFKGAVEEVRTACIRGMMYCALILGQKGLDLKPSLRWASKMADDLIADFSEATTDDAREHLGITLALLLRSLSKILSTVFNGQEMQYPPPELLTGSWITHLFKAPARLKEDPLVGNEIRSLVESFLSTRGDVVREQTVPVPAPVPVPALPAEESQESYGEFDISADDLAGIEHLNAPCPALTEIRPKHDAEDAEIIQIIEPIINYAVYTFICKHALTQELDERAMEDLNRWVDFWAQCANFLVATGRRDWKYHLDYGKAVWSSQGNVRWQRHVRLRFMWNALKLNHSVYEQHRTAYIQAFMEAVVTPRISVEHEYISKVLEVDHYQHPLLLGIDDVLGFGEGTVCLSKAELSRFALPIIEKIFSNFAVHSDDTDSRSSIEALFSAIPRARELFYNTQEELAAYESLSSEILAMVHRHGLNDPTLHHVLKRAFPSL